MKRHFTLKRILVLALSIVVLALMPGTSTVQAQTNESLHVQSVADQRIAKPGNAREASVYVVVQNHKGLVGRLTLKHFKLHAEQVGAGGCIIKAVRVHSGRKGIYRIDIVPGVKKCTWKKGVYVISTTVKYRGAEGASVATMKMK